MRTCLLGTALTFCTNYSAAQTSAPSSSTASTAQLSDSLAEVVVTAQRRTENAQTVPIAILSIAGDTLAQTFGADNVENLQQAIPGLSISMDTGNTKIFLRG